MVKRRRNSIISNVVYEKITYHNIGAKIFEIEMGFL